MVAIHFFIHKAPCHHHAINIVVDLVVSLDVLSPFGAGGHRVGVDNGGVEGMLGRYYSVVAREGDCAPVEDGVVEVTDCLDHEQANCELDGQARWLELVYLPHNF